MRDCLGRIIREGSQIECVNDVDIGKQYKVVSHLHTLGIMEEDGTFFPLKEFAKENGCLIDFRKC